MAGEADNAASLMALHIRGISEWYERESSRIPIRTQNGQSSVHLEVGESPAKLARSLALRIQDEIMGLGWPVGLHLGSESDLLTKYGVSRATFREAVRLLEYLGVASVRMGPKGGLVVTQPEPSTATEATGLLMEFNQISAHDLHGVRLLVELGCLDLLMARELTESEIDRLERATPLEPQAFDDPLVCHRLHHTVANLAGNPVLELFLRALNAVWARYEDGHFSSSGVEEVRNAHSATMDAVRSGDRALARIRLQRHLEALAPWFDARP
jgi:DNA-binding FadR family transcriptional regulator